MQLTIPAVVMLALIAPAAAAAEGQAPVGQTAPSLGLEHWWNTKQPLEPADLRGHVVLVRWWTDTCPFCATSAPVLNELEEAYGEKGLRILGIFHPKPPGDEDPPRMRRAAERFGFGFPVALDAHWKALDRWWLKLPGRRWTSISFLLDKKGVIRWVHPGGEYHTGGGGPHLEDHAGCRDAYRTLRATIERLLDE
jgi:thiol-disulfide isomerase/thioredoxin